MGNVALAEELVSIDELEELFELDASETEPEDDEEDDDEESDGEDDEGVQPEESRTADAGGRARADAARLRPHAPACLSAR